MQPSKREQAKTERRLVATLTEACEMAKAHIVGFEWLTHEVDYSAFPGSLRVIWIFDTQTSQDQALASGKRELMVELTAQALTDADVTLKAIVKHVQFDNEEQCLRMNGGDWRQRLARG